MSKIEGAAVHVAAPLILGQHYLLDTISKRSLAALLCLISMRIEVTARSMRAIPDSDRAHLRQQFEPAESWRIWLARYVGSSEYDYSYRYLGMLVDAPPPGKYVAPNCNTQVTTLIVGQLCAHLFSSTVWPDFTGYGDVGLALLWPPSKFDIYSREFPPITEEGAVWLHEAIARHGKPWPKPG